MRGKKRLPSSWQSFFCGLELLDVLDKLEMLGKLDIGRLILVFLSCFVLLDEFVLYITWNELVALEAHGEGSATTSK